MNSLVKFASIVGRGLLLHRNHENGARNFITSQISTIPGVPAKIGQLLLSQMADDVANESQPVPAMSLEEVKYIIKDESPKLWHSIDSISPEAKTASLGQVHKAELKNGTKVAIKIQYPGVVKELKSQLKALFFTAKLSPAKKYGLDLDAYKQFITESLLNELDYTKEAQEQRRFFEHFTGRHGITIPQPILELTSPTILVQSFEVSVNTKQVKQWWPISEKIQAAQQMLEFAFRSMIDHGHVHTDLHNENYGFKLRKNEKVDLVVYDFGSTLKIPNSAVMALLKLVTAYEHNRPLDPYDVFVHIGFDPSKLGKISKRLPILCQVLFEPLVDNRPFSPKKWNLKETFEQVLGADKWWFRTAGPPWFLYLMKSFQGALSAIHELDVAVDVRSLFCKIRMPYLQEIETFQIPISKISPEEGHASSIDCATHLKVSVNEGANSVVQVELPARAVDDLEDLIPEDNKDKIEQQGYDLLAIKKSVQRQGYQPSTLLDASIGNRRYLVELIKK